MQNKSFFLNSTAYSLFCYREILYVLSCLQGVTCLAKYSIYIAGCLSGVQKMTRAL